MSLPPRRRDGGRAGGSALGVGAWHGRLQREAKGGGGGAARRVGASAKQEGPGWLSTAPAAALHSGGGENRASRLEEGDKGPKRNFQKFQGPVCKLAITFKVKLK